MTAVAAEAAVVVDNGRETSGETSLWHGAAAGAAARVDQLLRRISDLTRFDRVSWGDLLQSRGATEEKRQAPGHSGEGEAKFRGFLAPAGRCERLINFYHYTFCLSL